MATLHFTPPSPFTLTHQTPTLIHQSRRNPHSSLKPVSIKSSLISPTIKPLLRHLLLPQATENGAQTENDPETTASIPEQTSSETDQQKEVGEQIKQAMKERELSSRSGDGGVNEFMSGVVEEIGMIEWPEFGKVLGTTGVVLGVIAGSSVVLLTLNAVLAELSDQVFAGIGVQDFFGG